MDPGYYPQRAFTIERLKAAVERSRTAYNEASQVYHALIDAIPTGLPFPDGTFQLKQAGERYRHALRAYSQAVRRLGDFVQTGIEDA